MKNGIRILRQEQNIALWSNQVQECNNSGLSVAKWCRENKIPASTYMNRQRKVFEAFSKDSSFDGYLENLLGCFIVGFLIVGFF
ncbi:MAG: IS66 family insertion sequence element accessory protein TnpA [Ruminococcus sp.]